MTEPLQDYYVGMLQGYLLAQNAPQKLFNALDHLVSGYRSRAGDMIGKTIREEVKPSCPEDEEGVYLTPAPVKIRHEPEVASRKTERPLPVTAEDDDSGSKSKKRPWTQEDDNDLIRMGENGSTADSIAYELDRTVGAVNARIFVLRKLGVI